MLKHTKGFMWRRKTNYKAAKEAMYHAWANAFVSRKLKKRDMRKLWQIRISAGAKQNDLSYSKFIGQLKKANIELDRKILSDLAATEPEVFKKVVDLASFEE